MGKCDLLFSPVDCDADVAERAQRRRGPRRGGGGEWRMERRSEKTLFSSGVSVEKKSRLGGSCHTSPLTSPVDVLMRCAMMHGLQTDRLEGMQGYRAASFTGFTIHSFPLSPLFLFAFRVLELVKSKSLSVLGL